MSIQHLLTAKLGVRSLRVEIDGDTNVVTLPPETDRLEDGKWTVHTTGENPVEIGAFDVKDGVIVGTAYSTRPEPHTIIVEFPPNIPPKIIEMTNDFLRNIGYQPREEAPPQPKKKGTVDTTSSGDNGPEQKIVGHLLGNYGLGMPYDAFTAFARLQKLYKSKNFAQTGEMAWILEEQLSGAAAAIDLIDGNVVCLRGEVHPLEETVRPEFLELVANIKKWALEKNVEEWLRSLIERETYSEYGYSNPAEVQDHLDELQALFAWQPAATPAPATPTAEAGENAR